MSLLASGAVVRVSCTLSNRFLGPVREKRDRSEEGGWDWDAEPEELRSRKGEKAVPEPSIGKAMIIASSGVAAYVFVGLVFGVLADVLGLSELADDQDVAVLALSTVPFGFAAFALLLTAMLPTTFWRAAMVSFISYALVLLVAGMAVGLVVTAWQLSGP